MKKLMKMVLSAWCLVLGAEAGTAAELPDGYTVIEYLTVPYGAHIDTGYTANGQTKVVMDAVVPARWEQNDRFGVLFGSRTMTAWTEKAFALQMCDGNTAVDTVRFAYNGAYRQDGGKPFSFGERVTVTCDGEHVEWTGSKAASVDFTAESLASSKSTLYIFADNSVAADGAKSKTGLNPSVMQLYSFKIYEGGTLKRDFVPVLNEKGERGMIDLANNNEFHPLVNDYAGQSIARVPAIVVPKGVYIDTGIKPDSETRVTMDVLIDRGESLSVLEGEYWFGCWDEDYNKGAFAFGNDGTGVYAGYGNQGGAVGSVVADGRHTVELDGNKVKVDGADYHSFTNESFALKQNLYLFAQNRAGFPIPFVSAYQSRIICMGCKIYHGGKLVRDYVPARMALIGAPYGLYDRVEGVFHGREGTVYYTNLDSTNLGLISSEISASATLMYRHWDEDSNGLVPSVSPQKCTFIDKDTDELLNDCWYAAVGDVTLGHGLILNNSVHLILTDGCYLEAQGGGRGVAGIEVEWGTTNDKLHIYGQEGDTGRLVAWGGSDAAGIGGRANSSYGSLCGEIYIHGGKIEAYGGGAGGAGIGGGSYMEVGYSWGGDGPAALEVYGGEILAVGGSWSAGIGGGGCSSGTGGGGSCGSIAIFGGVVEATGGVGIGPGLATSGYGTDMDLKISGGRVVAYVYDGAAIKLPSPDDLEIEGRPVSIWNSSSYLATAYNDGDWLTISREPVGTRWNPWRIGTTGQSGVPNGDVWAYREDDSIICNGQGSISASAFLPVIALSGLDVKAVKKLVIGKGITAVEGDAFTLMGTEKPVQLELPENWPADDRPTSIYVPWHGGHFYTRTYALTIPAVEPLEITAVEIDGVAQKELPASGESVDYVVYAENQVTVRYRVAGRTLEDTRTIGASGPDGEWIPALMTSVSYLDADGNECQTNAMVVTERTDKFENGHWYVAMGEVSRGGIDVVANGTANLILVDGASLTVRGYEDVAGIDVRPGETLSIYGQRGGTGRLTATGGDRGAGIGGGFSGAGGTVTINGGTVTAKGGFKGAGIGGGGYNGAGGTVMVNGGTVTAAGGVQGAGIGGGQWGAGGAVTINGGAVKAVPGESAAVVGRGYNGNGDGKVTITGGIFAMEINDAWYDRGRYVVTGNPDAETKDAYPFAVVRGVAVTVGEHPHMTAAWTSGDGSKTNAIGGAVFAVSTGTENVKVIFAADVGYSFAGGALTAEVLVGRADADCTVTAPEVQKSEIETFGRGWFVTATDGAYIDTFFQPDSNTRVEMDVKVQASSEYWFGCWDENYNRGAFAFGNDGWGIYAGYGNQGGTFGSVVGNGRHTVELNQNVVKVDEKQVNAFNTETFGPLKNNLYLFAQNRNGTVGVGGSQDSIICFGCSISTNTAAGAAIPVRNFVPARMKDEGQIVGLYDTVSGEFFSSRVGTLTLGHDEHAGPTCEGGTIAWSDAANAWVVTPNAGVTEVTITGLPDGAAVAVPPSVTKVSGVDDGKIKVRAGAYDITGAFTVSGGAIALDPNGSVTIGGETIPVKPTILLRQGYGGQVGDSGVSVTMRAIPGLKYSLVRGIELGAITTTVVEPTLATEAQMTLEDTDPPAGAAFYKVGVEK